MDRRFGKVLAADSKIERLQVFGPFYKKGGRFIKRACMSTKPS